MYLLHSSRILTWLLVFSFLVAGSAGPCFAADSDPRVIRIEQRDNELGIFLAEQQVARYVFQDEKIPRPYFADVKTPDGIQVTRNHPPVEGVDPTDHATYHPGIWLAFGEISGADFWRLKAQVQHSGFVSPPTTTVGTGSFVVNQVYKDGDRVVCLEKFTCTVVHVSSGKTDGLLLIHDSEFSNPDAEIVFGDQEEMGLGIRLATPLTAKHGNGTLTNAEGLINEEQVWGQATEWCDYSGIVEGQRVGMTILPHPENFRPSWMHARDYGLLVANPFGREALSKGEKSAVVVKPGETFRLRYGVWIYSTPGGNPFPTDKVLEMYLGAAK